jgi:hypothetical protein
VFDIGRRDFIAQGRNLDIDYRYGDVEMLQPLAQEKPPAKERNSPKGSARSTRRGRRCFLACVAGDKPLLAPGG